MPVSVHCIVHGRYAFQLSSKPAPVSSIHHTNTPHPAQGATGSFKQPILKSLVQPLLPRPRPHPRRRPHHRPTLNPRTLHRRRYPARRALARLDTSPQRFLTSIHSSRDLLARRPAILPRLARRHRLAQVLRRLVAVELRRRRFCFCGDLWDDSGCDEVFCERFRECCECAWLEEEEGEVSRGWQRGWHALGADVFADGE